MSSLTLASVVISIVFNMGPDLSNVQPKDWDKHPALGIVLVHGDYLISYPVVNMIRNDTLPCTGVPYVNVIDKKWTVCSEGLHHTLGEPMLYRRNVAGSHFINFDQWGK